MLSYFEYETFGDSMCHMKNMGLCLYTTIVIKGWLKVPDVLLAFAEAFFARSKHLKIGSLHSG